jgi:hypothetical protein
MNIILQLEPIIHLSPEQFISICHANPEAKLELISSSLKQLNVMID